MERRTQDNDKHVSTNGEMQEGRVGGYRRGNNTQTHTQTQETEDVHTERSSVLFLMFH